LYGGLEVFCLVGVCEAGFVFVEVFLEFLLDLLFCYVLEFCVV